MRLYAWSKFNRFGLQGCKATEFGEIMQNNGYYAGQGHSRSPIPVPMKSLYTTSCVSVIVTYILYRIDSAISRIIVQISGVNGGACV